MSNNVYPIPDKGPKLDKPVWVALLKESLKYLWDGQGRRPDQQSRYICLALTEAYWNGSCTKEELEDLKEKGIYQSLDCNFFEVFLAEKLQLPFWEERDRQDLIDLQDARRRFVMQLIKQFGG